MSVVATVKQNKIHPHKFTLWVGIGSILMMFAGLTSAYIVKRNQANWITFELPKEFWYSTAVILISSLTMFFAVKAFKERLMSRYRTLISVTMILGLLFIGLQILGFIHLWEAGITLKGVSYAFMYVIVGLHGLHVTGGVVALIVMALQAFMSRKKSYSVVPVEVMSTYWHFVDILWIYLLVFLLLIK